LKFKSLIWKSNKPSGKFPAKKLKWPGLLLNNTTFSEFFDQLQYTQQIYSSLGETLDLLKDQRRNLEIQGQNWQQKIAQEEDLKDELLNKKSEIDERSNAQQILLVQTQLNERAYQQNLHQLQLEQQQVNSEIITLERRVRETLENQEKNEFLQSQGPAELAWPVSPARGITAFFHDPSYPFRYIFEHPAIDIRAAQGTPIKAPAAGYVARVKFAGDKSYAFIMLIHNNGFSTVYGHVSQPLVQEEQLVTKGQIIGMTGGLAGSVGAGNLSTGPHLHLEVRLDGIPVDPLHYLPPY
jgi:murein DD-endopeptidase MepM/ murein hydrolase activator NlpD